MHKENASKLEILDCTLRDGGYYTHWDFDETLVNNYFKEINQLPVDYVEIGYRSKEKDSYEGAYFYLPQFILQNCKEKCDKKLAVILNEKEVEVEDLELLLKPCKGIIDLIRIAVDPKNLSRALVLSREIKKYGFSVGFNLMYASKWEEYSLYSEELLGINEVADYLYIVDSYGGLFPEDLEKIFSKISKYINIPIGFHGHDNLELALINSLTAIKMGAQIIDSTIMGMGRGAGNLKTELILTLLNKQRNLPVNFDSLFNLTNLFLKLKEHYRWGTNLPYMISGTFSMPQDAVMSKIKKRYSSLNLLINQDISNTPYIQEDQNSKNVFKPKQSYKSALIVGGGKSTIQSAKAHLEFLKANPEIAIIFVSSKNVPVFSNISNKQFHCLTGNEGYRLEDMIKNMDLSNKTFIIPPKSSSVESFVPKELKEKTEVMSVIDFESELKESATSLAFQIAFDLKVNTIYLTGYDGYSENIQKEELELFEENQLIFNNVARRAMNLYSITQTLYQVSSKSIYQLL